MDLIKINLKEAEVLQPLFLLADPDLKAINKYLGKSDIFALKSGSVMVGAVCVLPGKKTVEIKNFAVAEIFQKKGLGSFMIRLVFAYYKKMGFEDISVGTACEVPYILEFYKKHGFEEESIIKNFFTDNYDKPVYDGNILCKDMIILKHIL